MDSECINIWSNGIIILPSYYFIFPISYKKFQYGMY